MLWGEPRKTCWEGEQRENDRSNRIVRLKLTMIP